MNPFEIIERSAKVFEPIAPANGLIHDLVASLDTSDWQVVRWVFLGTITYLVVRSVWFTGLQILNQLIGWTLMSIPGIPEIYNFLGLINAKIYNTWAYRGWRTIKRPIAATLCFLELRTKNFVERISRVGHEHLVRRRNNG